MNAGPKKPLPKEFIDVLLKYAVDPTQWEKVAQELNAREPILSRLAPNDFLNTLSRAEALAWQIGNAAHSESPWIALDKEGQPVAASASAVVAEIVDVAELSFYSVTSQQNIAATLREINSKPPDSDHQSLVVLATADGSTRYGYLIPAKSLPNPAQETDADTAYGLYVSAANMSDHTERVLRSSFNINADESQVCSALLGGADIEDITRDNDKSREAVVTELQAILDKTGLHSQSQLILLLTQLNVLLAAAPEATNIPTDHEYPAHSFAIVDQTRTPRRIAYREYGEGKNTVVYFHESAGTSRLPPGTAQLANKHNLRIVAIDRPGFGFSDLPPVYNFDALASDITDMVLSLSCERVAFLGFLSGGAHALCAAASLGEVVDHVMLVSARAPTHYETDEESSLAVIRRKLIQQPWLLKTFFNILRSRTNAQSNANILKRIYGAPAADKALLEERPEVLEHMVGYTLESLTVSAGGLVGEISCFSNPTFVDLSNIKGSITVWHGEEDLLAPIDQLRRNLMGLEFTERLFKGWGSLLHYAYWPDVLAQLAQDIETRRP